MLKVRDHHDSVSAHDSDQRDETDPVCQRQMRSRRLATTRLWHPMVFRESCLQSPLGSRRESSSYHTTAIPPSVIVFIVIPSNQCLVGNDRLSQSKCYGCRKLAFPLNSQELPRLSSKSAERHPPLECWQISHFFQRCYCKMDQ